MNRRGIPFQNRMVPRPGTPMSDNDSGEEISDAEEDDRRLIVLSITGLGNLEDDFNRQAILRDVSDLFNDSDSSSSEWDSEDERELQLIEEPINVLQRPLMEGTGLILMVNGWPTISAPRINPIRDLEIGTAPCPCCYQTPCFEEQLALRAQTEAAYHRFSTDFLARLKQEEDYVEGTEEGALFMPRARANLLLACTRIATVMLVGCRRRHLNENLQRRHEYSHWREELLNRVDRERRRINHHPNEPEDGPIITPDLEFII
ncbi:hypothetical protein CRE_20099 [Caenorhabditis remanei]|uniref:Uncharacterized protein n=1 Tax=Caenorhabditis remanei TaxID=31234 RepID=E3NML9_CAERE|nr:hypothetical protein CRE_20099 [Caenorhabditis remanei]